MGYISYICNKISYNWVGRSHKCFANFQGKGYICSEKGYTRLGNGSNRPETAKFKRKCLER